MKNKNFLRQMLVILATLATLVVNGRVTALPINGKTPEEITDIFYMFLSPPDKFYRSGPL